MGDNVAVLRPVCDWEFLHPLVNTVLQKALTYLLQTQVHYRPPLWAAVDNEAEPRHLDAGKQDGEGGPGMVTPPPLHMKAGSQNKSTHRKQSTAKARESNFNACPTQLNP